MYNTDLLCVSEPEIGDPLNGLMFTGIIYCNYIKKLSLTMAINGTDSFSEKCCEINKIYTYYCEKCKTKFKWKS